MLWGVHVQFDVQRVFIIQQLTGVQLRIGGGISLSLACSALKYFGTRSLAIQQGWPNFDV